MRLVLVSIGAEDVIETVQGDKLGAVVCRFGGVCGLAIDLFFDVRYSISTFRRTSHRLFI